MSYPYSATYTVSAGDTILAVHYNTGNSDHINSNIPENIDDYSANAAEMQATTDPYPAAAVSLATTLDGELQRLRYVIKQLSGEAHWYIDPDATIASLYANTPVSATNWPSFSVNLGGAPGSQTNITGTDQVEFNNEVFDTNSDFNTTLWRFLPTVTGKYLLAVTIDWNVVTITDQLIIYIYKNGAVHALDSKIAEATEQQQDITIVVDANGTTDYFEVFANNAARDTSTINGVVTQTYWTGCRIG